MDSVSKGDWPLRPISELAQEYTDEMEGKGSPTAMGSYPSDPTPVPVCATCGSDNVHHKGVEQLWCYECEGWREVEDAKE